MHGPTDTQQSRQCGAECPGIAPHTADDLKAQGPSRNERIIDTKIILNLNPKRPKTLRLTLNPKPDPLGSDQAPSPACLWPGAPRAEAAGRPCPRKPRSRRTGGPQLWPYCGLVSSSVSILSICLLVRHTHTHAAYTRRCFGAGRVEGLRCGSGLWVGRDGRACGVVRFGLGSRGLLWRHVGF